VIPKALWRYSLVVTVGDVISARSLGRVVPSYRVHAVVLASVRAPIYSVTTASSWRANDARRVPGRRDLRQRYCRLPDRGQVSGNCLLSTVKWVGFFVPDASRIVVIVRKYMMVVPRVFCAPGPSRHLVSNFAVVSYSCSFWRARSWICRGTTKLTD
jgi:hypothetical protein